LSSRKSEIVNTPPEWKFDPAAVEDRLKKWFPKLPEKTIASLLLYQTELLKFNKTLNLVSESTAKVAESVHVADSVLASQLISPLIVSDQPVYDFGSGNGCPGLIFAILNPARKVILVDRDQRKLEFCKHAASSVGASNVSVLVKGIEELPDRSVMTVISRGFAPLQKALIVCRKPVAKGGRFFHMKGDGWANELANIPTQVFSHWSPSLVGKYQIPGPGEVEMSLVLTEKIAD
jgi:16S rRNA (guanine527-N7)-methyltransferase